MKMIDHTKKYDEAYLDNLKENLFVNPYYDESESLETELNEREETFRNPNLLIQTIKEMQQRQDEFLKDIQLKLNQMTKIKDHLKIKNKFQPNLSSFDQNETSLFGSIKLPY
jgi:hypothetical protein